MDDFVNAKAKAESEEKFLRSFSHETVERRRKNLSHEEQQRDDDDDDDEAKTAFIIKIYPYLKLRVITMTIESVSRNRRRARDRST